MSEQRFPPRVWIDTKQFKKFNLIHAYEKTSEADDVEYIPLFEHEHLMAENERRIERLREALEYYSCPYIIEIISSQYFESHSDGFREFGYAARATLQEDDK